jgi:hypothetical protein
MKKLADSGQYPHVTEFLTAVSQLEVDADRWGLAGVDLILDGIEARLAGLGEPDSGGPREGT